MKQVREGWSCTRDSVEAYERYFLLNPAADWQPVDKGFSENEAEW